MRHLFAKTLAPRASSLGLEPKNVDFPGPGAYATTRPWQSQDHHTKKVPFNSTGSRNDRRAFTNLGAQHVRNRSSFLRSILALIQSVGVGRYNLLGPIRDETIADKRKRPKRRNIGFHCTTSRFGSTSDNSLLTYALVLLIVDIRAR